MHTFVNQVSLRFRLPARNLTCEQVLCQDLLPLPGRVAYTPPQRVAPGLAANPCLTQDAGRVIMSFVEVAEP